MTETTAASGVDNSRPATASWGHLLLGLLLGGLVILAGNWDVEEGENGGTKEAWISAGIVVVIAAVIWFVVLPRIRNADRTATILSVLAILTILVFWLGATPVLAAGALVALARGSAPSTAAKALTVLAVVAALVTVVGTLVQSNLFD
jgi:cell division protein FtsW (lipid II flippase)